MLPDSFYSQIVLVLDRIDTKSQDHSELFDNKTRVNVKLKSSPRVLISKLKG